MKRVFLIAFLLFAGAGYADRCHAQHVAVKTNALYWVAATPNLAMEVGLSPRWTFDLSASYNPWTHSGNRKWKHLLLQPEARYWFCERFDGHFVGLHAHWAKYNVGGVKMPFGLWKETRDHRYQGDLYGFGFTYGYQWILGRHWNLEAAIGIGYARVHFDEYPCAGCGRKTGSGTRNYVGPTKAALSLVYLF